MQWQRNDLILTDTPTPESVEATYRLLQTTYWSHMRPMETVQLLIENSLCFFLIQDRQQVGFGRVVTDFATVSWVADIVIDEKLQGSGAGTWLMACILDHPKICDTQFILQTGTAHAFYERFGFARKESLMSTPVDYLN